MADRETAEAQAKQRFILINLMRLTGVAMVLAGLVIANGAFDLPMWVGIILIVFGMIEALIMPTFMARMWSTNERP
ncbi:hypothetical protein [Aurantiacibacter sp. D1-12]|uniref:hypothetical protein n=1 Tax=Aurantiacibacter sp. D1-12 TaxID=2993658 RepID=UPI00237CBC2F|nr:hypothetical protein [Aurantiacibacter sp. D1-12]MDE1467043.1 hypothetical protein [Aurantiacibacter sp. D1-12]